MKQRKFGRTATSILFIIAILLIGCSAVSVSEPGSGQTQDKEPSVVVALKGGQETGPEPGAESGNPAESAPAEAPAPVATPTHQRAQGPLAAQVEGIAAWINSEPLAIDELRGKVVLVDFWTYTCINCIRTFPYLKLWHARYADDGLVILGVHTPEFEFEKDYDNVVQATKDNGIIWPVAQDNDYTTWRNYSNQYWPAKYLIDRDGVIRYTHFGEGGYAETERQIREFLEEAGADLSDDPLVLPSDQAVDPTFLATRNAQVTPELYAGYERNYSAALSGRQPYVVQTEYFRSQDQVAELEAPEDPSPHKIYFNGPWLVEPQRSKHARSTTGYEDYIAINYSAKSVNAVLTSDSGESYRVRVTMDGDNLTETNKGRDVMIGEDGESFLLVDEARLYEVVDNPEYRQNKVLRLSSNSADFGLFAFVFGVYQEGP